MKLIYLSTAISDLSYKHLIETCSSGAPTYSGIGFDFRIWNAMRRIVPDTVAYTYLPLPKQYDFDAANFQEESIKIISYNNKSIFKEWSFIHKTEKEIEKEINNSNEEICILLSGLYRVFVFTALRVKKKNPKVTIVGIVPDLPELMSAYYGKGNLFHQIKMAFDSSYGKRQKRMLDGYIFLSKAMNNIVNTANKPYAIMEGLIDDFEFDSEIIKSKQKTIVYAGKVGHRFGVIELVKAFRQAEINNCTLHLYGSGDAFEEAKQLSRDCNNIVIHGIQPHEIVLMAEKEATFLIEPRNPNEDFCSYCFPSKVLEYMSTGTPVIMAPLPGMDDRFKSLFIPISPYSIDNMGQIIKKVLLDKYDKYETLGKCAQLFVKNNMTSSVQAKEIYNVIRQSTPKNQISRK